MRLFHREPKAQILTTKHVLVAISQHGSQLDSKEGEKVI